jgi:hypothetical protein
MATGDGQTANYHWYLPVVGASATTWGTSLNSDLEQIDQAVFTNQTAITDLNARFTVNSLTLNKAHVADGALVYGQSAGVNRWALDLGEGTAETSANTGSNFTVYRYADNGDFIDSPFSINRASGAATFQDALTVSGALTANNGANVLVASTLTVSGALTANGGITTSQGITYGGTNGGAIGFGWDGTNGFLNFFVNGGSLGPVIYSNIGGGFTNIRQMGLNGGNSTVQAQYNGGTFSWPITFSDRRLKRNVQDVTIDALGLLKRLPVHSADLTNPLPGGTTEHWDCALIADEIEHLVPRAYSAAPEDGYASIRELPLIATLIKAIQQLTARVEELEAAR